MPHHRSWMRPARRLVAGLGAVTFVFGSITAAAPGLAGATPASSARERAHHLRQQLAGLQVQAELAGEEYDATEAQLGQVVAEHTLAQEQLQNARSAASGANADQTATVRALYRAGGASALYATVFDSTNPGDVFARLRVVQHLVDGQQAVTRAAEQFVGGAARIEAHLADLAHRRTKLDAQAGAAMARVQSAIARQQQLVASADADIVRLEQAEAAQVAAASAAQAAATLNAARAAATPGGPGDVTAPNTTVVSTAMAAARQQLGKPYQWGATGPGAFDCSGLTGWAYQQAGLFLPRTSRQQWLAGPHPGLGYLQPGDLLFWATNTTDPATIHHVALYIGNDQMIAAPHTGAVVTVQPVYLDGYIGAVRPTAVA